MDSGTAADYECWRGFVPDIVRTARVQLDLEPVDEEARRGRAAFYFPCELT
jgi:hypothetical protein